MDNVTPLKYEIRIETVPNAIAIIVCLDRSFVVRRKIKYADQPYVDPHLVRKTTVNECHIFGEFFLHVIFNFLQIQISKRLFGVVVCGPLQGSSITVVQWKTNLKKKMLTASWKILH